MKVKLSSVSGLEAILIRLERQMRLAKRAESTILSYSRIGLQALPEDRHPIG